jgi:carbonic anhydrase
MTIIQTCTCCSDLLQGRLSRRRFIQGAAAGAAALTLAPFPALAAEGKYEAMTLSCIDPRTQEGVRRNMVKRHLIGKYSQVILAGAAIGVVAPAFNDWHKAFWDNLAASVQLHSIKKVIVINHRDCGAAKIAYGADSIKMRDAETKLHQTVLADFRKQCNERQPKLGVETGLISLQGKVEMFA